LKKRALESLEVADYTEKKLNEMGVNAWRNPNAITVVLTKPPIEIVQKWQLASEVGLSHIICMPGVTKEVIDSFLDDLKKSLAVA